MRSLLIIASLLSVASGEFAPTSWHDWIWWKLGFFPDWGANSIGITTSFGRMQAWTFGNKKSSQCALTLHGGMDVESIHHDFDNISSQLVEQFDYFVISPNFHSLKAASPGRITTPQMATLMHDLAKYGGCKRFTMVLGKAWGAAMAARVSVDHPKLIHKLVLVAPGPLREDFAGDNKITIPVFTLVLFAQDDSSINSWAMQALRKNTPNLTQGYGIYKGGHKMLPAYNEDIIWFAKRAIPDDDEEAEDNYKPNPAHSDEL